MQGDQPQKKTVDFFSLGISGICKGARSRRIKKLWK